MSRILLADDSPHAQRMGERILREEGFEVVTVTDGETALIRLADVEPDVVMVDVFLPRRSGYELCDYIKKHPRHRHARVVLLAGLLEPVDEAEARRVSSDGVLKKPFEPSAVVAMVRPLAEAAQLSRDAVEFEDVGQASGPVSATPALAHEEPEAPQAAGADSVTDTSPPAAIPQKLPPTPPADGADAGPTSSLPAPPEPAAVPLAADQAAHSSTEPAAIPAALGEVAASAPESDETAEHEPLQGLVEIDPERIRAAVTIALDRAMPAMIDEITERVLVALGH